MPKDDETSVDQEIVTPKQANESLEEDNRRFQHLLSNAPTVTYSFEARGDFRPTFISENVKKVFGYEPQEYLTDNKFAGRRVHPEDAKRVKGELSRLFEIGQLIIEYRFLCKDDNYRWVSDEMQLIRDEKGEPLEVVGSWHDITVQRQINEDLTTIKVVWVTYLVHPPSWYTASRAKEILVPPSLAKISKRCLGTNHANILKTPSSCHHVFIPKTMHVLTRCGRNYSEKGTTLTNTVSAVVMANIAGLEMNFVCSAIKMGSHSRSSVQ